MLGDVQVEQVVLAANRLWRKKEHLKQQQLFFTCLMYRQECSTTIQAYGRLAGYTVVRRWQQKHRVAAVHLAIEQ